MENDNDTTLDNLIDLTAYKLRSLVKDMAAAGHSDLADALQEALDEYLLGTIDIAWQSGWPHTIDVKENDT